ncbi:MAG: hypothetical protein IKN53_00500 [Oscillibacter sp.]|nr:hypothetical protein [Oscillibacter sp.]
MFTERFNELLSQTCQTTTGEFAKITKYDRSYVSHLRNGDRMPKAGHSAARRLSRAVYVCAAERNGLDALCDQVGAPRGADEETLCAAVHTWLFGEAPAQRETRPAAPAARGRRRSSFGDRLGLAMELANVSAMRLARALNVDASLISKYRSGLRVPRVNHPVIREIGAVLAARIYALDRIAGLAQLLGVPRAELTGESVGAKRLEAWLRDFSAADTSLIEGFLEGVDAFPSGAGAPLLPPEAAADEATRNDCAEYYDGVDGLRRAVLRFLANAVESRQPSLLLYSDQSIDWLVTDRDFALRWASLMSAYVGGGGKIRIIHNVDRGLEEMIEAIRKWLPLYLSGGIESWYCTRSGGDRFTHTLFLAPQRACIFGVHAAQGEHRARYRYATQAQDLAHYAALFEDLLADCRPLLTMSRYGAGARLPAVMRDGAVHSVVRTLSLATMPEPLLRAVLARSAVSDETARKVLAERASQRELMEELLERGEFRECIALPEEAALYGGQVALDTAYAPLFYLPEEYGEHVRSVLALTEQTPNYHVYPLKEPPFARIKLVASEHAAVIVSHPITFTATNPLMCRAFVGFAERLEEQYDVDRVALRDKLKQYT